MPIVFGCGFGNDLDDKRRRWDSPFDGLERGIVFIRGVRVNVTWGVELQHRVIVRVEWRTGGERIEVSVFKHV